MTVAAAVLQLTNNDLSQWLQSSQGVIMMTLKSALLFSHFDASFHSGAGEDDPIHFVDCCHRCTWS